MGGRSTAPCRSMPVREALLARLFCEAPASRLQRARSLHLHWACHLTVLAALVCASTLVRADSATVASGVKTQLTTHARFDRRCKPIPVVIKFVAPPLHGTATSEPKRILVPAVSARGVVQPSHCVGVQVDGVAIYYRSAPGFVGEDSFRYLRVHPDDASDPFNADITYTITVQ